MSPATVGLAYACRDSDHRPSTVAANRASDFDIPGVVPIYCGPRDLIIFAARTMHAAFPVPDDFPDVRHSVGVGLRSTRALQGDFEGATVAECPWPIPDSAQRVIEETRGTCAAAPPLDSPSQV